MLRELLLADAPESELLATPAGRPVWPERSASDVERLGEITRVFGGS